MYMSVYWCVDVQSVCMPVNLSLSAYVLCVVCAIIVCTCMLCLSIQRKILNDIVTKCFIHCSHEIFLVVLMCECV